MKSISEYLRDENPEFQEDGVMNQLLSEEKEALLQCLQNHKFPALKLFKQLHAEDTEEMCDSEESHNRMQTIEEMLKYSVGVWKY